MIHPGPFPALARGRRARAAAVALLASVAFVACGSTSDSTTSGPGISSETRAELEAIVAKYEVKPTSIGLTEPLKELPKGAKVGWLGNGTENDIGSFETFKEAANLLDMDVTSLSRTADIEATVSAIEQARNRGFDLVILNGILPSALGPQLRALHDSGVKVLGYALSTDGFSAPGVDFAFYPNSVGEKVAAIMADYVVLNTDGPAHILLPYIPDIAQGVAMLNTFENRVKETCKSCTVQKLDFSFGQIGSQLPARVVSAFEANPRLNAIYNLFGAAYAGIPEALKQSGRTDVLAATASGIELNMQQIKAGQLSGSLDIGLGYRGYMLADAAARLLAGQEIPTDVYMGFDFPVQLHTKDNLDFDITKPWEGAPDDYKEQFKRLWGLG